VAWGVAAVLVYLLSACQSTSEEAPQFSLSLAPPDKLMRPIDRLLEGIHKRDSLAFADALLRNTTFHRVQANDEGQHTVVAVSAASFVRDLTAPGLEFTERIWDVRFDVRGLTAVVTAAYDFRIEGAFSHCGVDVMDLVMTNEGWRIASVTYSVTGRTPPECLEQYPTVPPWDAETDQFRFE
jgi:hypothetical protein